MTSGKGPVSVPRPKSRAGKAYSTPPIAQPSTAMSSSSRELDPRDELMIQMASSLKDLQEEVSQMRAERPRKITANKE